MDGDVQQDVLREVFEAHHGGGMGLGICWA